MLSNTQENENQPILIPEEIKNEETKEQELKNEETKEQETKEQELKNEEIKNEETKEQELKNEELKPQETKEEDNATKISETLDSLSIDIETKNNKKNLFQRLFLLFIRPCSSS
jgi:hypothetical protein